MSGMKAQVPRNNKLLSILNPPIEFQLYFCNQCMQVCVTRSIIPPRFGASTFQFHSDTDLARSIGGLNSAKKSLNH